jgi:hypothetical protein
VYSVQETELDMFRLQFRPCSKREGASGKLTLAHMFLSSAQYPD